MAHTGSQKKDPTLLVARLQIFSLKGDRGIVPDIVATVCTFAIFALSPTMFTTLIRVHFWLFIQFRHGICPKWQKWHLCKFFLASGKMFMN